MHGCFVSGTDTGVGKTVVSAAIVAALRASGSDAVGLKPIVTGTDDPPPGPWPADHELLATVSGLSVGQVNFTAYGPPVSPHLAAELSGRAVDPAALVTAIQRAGAGHETVVVEGVGGLLVPLIGDYGVRELARELGLPVVLVARPGLGTINHTLLTLEAARGCGLAVAGVVLNPWPADPDPLQRSNRDTIAALGEVAVTTFPLLSGPDADALAFAGATLPLSAWLGAARRGEEPGGGR
jgi:dethiobiotin synthetase